MSPQATFSGTTQTNQVVTQTFILQPQFALQTFTFSADFVNLKSLSFEEFFTAPTNVQFTNVSVELVPEPGTTSLLFSAGIIGLTLARRRKLQRRISRCPPQRASTNVAVAGACVRRTFAVRGPSSRCAMPLCGGADALQPSISGFHSEATSSTTSIEAIRFRLKCQVLVFRQSRARGFGQIRTVELRKSARLRQQR
jgi:hypothetical protein